MNAIKTLVVFALCAVPFAAHAGADATSAAPSAVQCTRVAGPTGHVQRQVIEKAQQGIRPLAQYVYRTRMIHQLDLFEVVAWLDQRRDPQACA